MKKALFSLLIAALLTLASCTNSGEKPEQTRVDAPVSMLPSADSTDQSESENTPVVPLSPEEEETIFIDSIIAEMTLEEKIGQLFLVRADTSEKDALADIENYHLGGYVLFAADFQKRDVKSAKALSEKFQSASKIPMLLSVDEEGGTVTRVSRYTQYRASKFLSPRDLLAKGGLELVRTDTAEKCKLLASLGLNVNLAPVADISEKKSEFIYYRSAGNAKSASDYVSAFVQTSIDNQFGAVLKHFPGYGGNADTHVGVAVDKRPITDFEKSDFLPFKAGIEAGVGAVMVSHNIVECMDKTNPASLSPEVHRVLRETLEFDGVIITDDLEMDAISKQYPKGEAAVLAIESGGDIVCTSNFEQKYDAVLAAVKSGRISEERIEESVARVLKWKLALGLIEN